jgi:lysozyme
MRQQAQRPSYDDPVKKKLDRAPQSNRDGIQFQIRQVAPSALSIDLTDSHHILSKFEGSVVLHYRRRRMNDRDYGKLLAQVMHFERGWQAPYCGPAGNLIVAADRHGQAASVGLERMTVLEAELRRVALDLEDILPAVGRLDAVRYRVLVHMAFNMGVRGLFAMNRLVAAVEIGFWATAAQEMLISQWAKPNPGRATVLAAMMRTGRDDALTVSQPRSA